MTDNGSPSPASFSGSLSDPDSPLLREHFRDLSRWVIGDAVGERLGAGERDALAGEIAVVLASSLAPVLRREVESQAEKIVAGLQKGPLSFDHDHQVRVGGFTVAEVMKLLDAVGRLVEAGVGEAVSGLHETHQRMLYGAHDAWLAKNDQRGAGSDS